MSGSSEERYRRLLRWYPRSWRAANEDVVLGTMLDVAEQDQRDGPSGRERWSVALYGLGIRMNATAALGAVSLGLLLAAVAGGLAVWGAPAPLLTVAVIPFLTFLGLISIARQRQLTSPPRAVAVVLLSLPAFALAFFALQAWGLAFDLADERLPVTGLAAASMPLAFAAWLIGAASVATFLDAAFSRSGMPRGVALLLGGACGLVAPPLIGAALLPPAASTIGAAGVAVWSLALLPARRARRVSMPIPERTRRLARILTGLSLVAGVVGVGYALTGASWSPGAADGTVAMAQGLTISVLSGIPLLGASTIIAAARDERHRSAWVPFALMAGSLGTTVVAFLYAPSWNGMAPALAVSAALAGAALTCWSAVRLRGPVAARVLVAVLLGLGYASFLGVLVAPMLAFLIPIAASIRAITTRRPRGALAPPSGAAGRGALAS